MKTCTVYRCNAKVPRNSEVCFACIKNGVPPLTGVEIVLDREAGSIEIANNTSEGLCFDVQVWTTSAMWRKSGYLDILRAQFEVHESLMHGTGPYMGQMELKCR